MADKEFDLTNPAGIVKTVSANLEPKTTETKKTPSVKEGVDYLKSHDLKSTKELSPWDKAGAEDYYGKKDTAKYNKKVDQAMKNQAKPTEPQVLTEFVKEKVIPQIKTSGQPVEKPYRFKKGERVSMTDGNKEKTNNYEVVGFYHQGNVIDENKADDYDKDYSIRVRNTDTGKEYPVNARWLKAASQEPAAWKYSPFKLDKTKFADVEETPYGYIYNYGGQSITDHNAMHRSFKKRDPNYSFNENRDYGWTRTTPYGDEVYHKTFEDAYNGIKENNRNREKESAAYKIRQMGYTAEQAKEIAEKFTGDDLKTAVERLEQGEGYGDVLNGVIKYENKEQKQPKKSFAEEWNNKIGRESRISAAVDNARSKGQTPQQVMDSVSYDLDIEPNSDEYKTLKDYAMQGTRLNKETGAYEYNKYNLGSNKLLSDPKERQKIIALANAFKKAGVEDVQVKDGYEDYGADMKWTNITSDGAWVLNPRDWLDYMNGNATAEEIVKKNIEKYVKHFNTTQRKVGDVVYLEDGTPAKIVSYDPQRDDYVVEWGRGSRGTYDGYELDKYESQDYNYFEYGGRHGDDARDLVFEDIQYIIDNQLDNMNFETIDDAVAAIKAQPHVGSSYRNLKNVDDDMIASYLEGQGYDFIGDVIEEPEEKPLHIRSLENQTSYNPMYKKIADSLTNDKDANDAYFYAFKDAFEKHGYAPTNDQIKSELQDRYYDLMDGYQQRYGLYGREWDWDGIPRFEEEYGTEDEFIRKGINAYINSLEERKQPQAQPQKQEQKVDMDAAKRENTSLYLLDQYNKGKIDLETLHNELLKAHGNNMMSAFDWLLKNARR